MELEKLLTEKRNPNTMDIDLLPTIDILQKINSEDQRVPETVAKNLPAIASLVDKIVDALNSGGRLVYIGAGTSGRLGILDASECPPTYGVDKNQVIGIIAGGADAMDNAIEGSEDDTDQAIADLEAITLNHNDVLIGIAASGRTPYTASGMTYAKSVNATVGAIVCSPGSIMEAIADIPVVVEVGPEVITGSTRMKAGTAQKLVLNMLTTAAMIRYGKVYGNLMVDVQLSNQKLEQRAANMVQTVTGVSEADAKAALAEYGSTKAAIFSLLTGIKGEKVGELLTLHKGRLREAIQAQIK